MADAWSLGSGSGGDAVEVEGARGKAPTTIRSRSSWRTFPGAVSVAPMRDTPERMGVPGNAAKKGFSIFSPFWRSMMLVCPGVTAGAISDVNDGGISGMFFVVTMMKSYGLVSFSAWISGIVVRTGFCG